MVKTRRRLPAPDETPLKKAIRIAGGLVVVGQLYTPPISAQAVSNWFREGGPGIPAERVLLLEAATAAKNDLVSRYELCPATFGQGPPEPAVPMLPE